MKIKGVFVQVTEQFLQAKNQKKKAFDMSQPLDMQILKLLNSVEELHLVDPDACHIDTYAYAVEGYWKGTKNLKSKT